MAVAIDQLQILILFILAIFISVAIAYFIRRRGVKFPFYRVMFLALLIVYSIFKFLEGDVMAVLFAWFSAIMAVSVTFDILDFLDRKLNEKLAAGLMLIVISGGGVLANILIFSTPVSAWAKVFSLAVLIAVHTPFLIALIAYSRGKRKLSKKLVRNFCFGKNS